MASQFGYKSEHKTLLDYIGTALWHISVKLPGTCSHGKAYDRPCSSCGRMVRE